MSGAVPGYWRDETSGVLRPAIEAYLLRNEPMTAEQIAAIRAYLRQWIASPIWRGDGVAELLRRIDDLTSEAAIEAWLDDAAEWGIDPL